MDTTYQQESTSDLAQQLQEACLGVKLSQSKWGISKSLNSDQKQSAANVFGADAKSLSAGKKLVNVKNEAYKAVADVLAKSRAYWQSVTRDFPETGVRLLDKEQIEAFNAQIASFQSQLDGALVGLQQHYYSLRMEARRNLGSLFCEDDYPERIDDQFSITSEFVNFSPPEYLRQNFPDLYEAAKRRIDSRFEQVVDDLEAQFCQQFSELLTKIVGKLSGLDDGSEKRFCASTLTNLTGFFDSFKQLSCRSNSELDTMVDQAKAVVTGLEPDHLRNHKPLRDRIRQDLANVSSQLDTMMVTKQRRIIFHD